MKNGIVVGALIGAAAAALLVQRHVAFPMLRGWERLGLIVLGGALGNFAVRMFRLLTRGF